MVDAQALLNKRNRPLTRREGHRLVLSLLRSGALEQAEKEYYLLGLHRIVGDEDIQALGGRILKSKAQEKRGEERAAIALEAAEKYKAVYSETKGTYTGINTAALYLVAGDSEKAKQFATEVLELLPQKNPAPGEDAYYYMATAAEAELIMGRYEAARTIVSDAVQLDPHNYEAHASTVVQFDMLLDSVGADKSWLDDFRPPCAVHYAGHIFGLPGSKRELDPIYLHGLERSVAEKIMCENFGFAFGALAAGADIVIAEQMLKAGVELHVVLPCSEELFIATSVSPFGEGWVPRFKACMAAAKSLKIVSANVDIVDDLALSFGSEVAMGHAVLKAQKLATEAIQFLVWDQEKSLAQAGTSRDALLWSGKGRRQICVSFPESRAEPANYLPKPLRARNLKAMIFMDVRGFGALPDTMVPLFLDKIFKPLSVCVQMQKKHIKHLNTWGDGLFIVLDDIEAAATAAIEMQSCFQQIDLEKAGLPSFLALRVAGHYGTVYKMDDPILETPGFFGKEVSFAARIEPVTVPGSIYVSEPFACALAANSVAEFRCEYVGEITPRKDQQPLPLFSLRKC